MPTKKNPTIHSKTPEQKKPARAVRKPPAIVGRSQAADPLQESQALLNAIVDSTSDMIWSVDPENFGLLTFNRSLKDYFSEERGLHIKIGDRPQDLFPPGEFVERWQSMYAQALAKAPYSVEYRVFAGTRTLELNFNLLKRENKIFGISVFGKDITERKLAEEALRLSEEKWRTLVNALPDYIALHDPEGRYLFLNHYAKGFAEKDVVGTSLYQFLIPESVEIFRNAMEKALQTWTVQHFEMVALGDDSSPRTYEEYLVPLHGQDQQPYTLAVASDITERKQSQALQQAIYQIAAAADTSTSLDELYPQIHQIIATVMPAENFFIALYDEAKKLLYFPYLHDAEDEIYLGGMEPGKGTTAYVLRTGKSLLCTREVRAELERRGEMTLQGAPSAIWLGVPLIVEGKTIGAMVVQHYSDPKAYGEREQHILEFVSTQVAIAIDRKQAEEALSKSEKRYRDLFENSPVSLWEQDFSVVKRHLETIRQSGVMDFRAFFTAHPEELRACMHEIRVLDVNAATLALYRAAHKDQLTGTLERVVQIDDVKDFLDEFVVIAEGGTEFAWEGTNTTLDGEKLSISLHWSAAPGFEDSLEKVLVSIVDITERKRTEEALRESESRYRGLFENSPVSLWEEDFSGVKCHIEVLRRSGVTDFRAYFSLHPDVLQECIGEIKVLDVNQATLALTRATRKVQLIGNLNQVISIDPSIGFVDEFVSIAEGKTELTWESINYNWTGKG